MISVKFQLCPGLAFLNSSVNIASQLHNLFSKNGIYPAVFDCKRLFSRTGASFNFNVKKSESIEYCQEEEYSLQTRKCLNLEQNHYNNVTALYQCVVGGTSVKDVEKVTQTLLILLKKKYVARIIRAIRDLVMQQVTNVHVVLVCNMLVTNQIDYIQIIY